MAENQGKMGRPRGRADGAADAVAVIKTFAEERGLTQEALGDLAGVGQTSVSRALNQKEPVFTPTLEDLFHYVKSQGDGGVSPKAARQVKSEEAASKLQKAALDAWDGTQVGLERLVRLLGDLKSFRGPRRGGA